MIEPATATVPGRGGGLVDVVRHRYLLRLLVRKELRVRYRGSLLGLAWSYVKPAVQFAVFYLALGHFLGLRFQLVPFAVYLFSGIVAVNFFSEGFSNATRAVVLNAALVKKIYLPRELFPVSMIVVAMVHLLPQLIVLTIGSLLSGWRPRPADAAAAALGFLIIAILALGLGLLFGALNVLYRDLENIVDLILMVVVWLSPVLYPWTRVRDTLGEGSLLLTIYQLNPVTVGVELFHRAFWYTASDRSVPMPELKWHTIVALALSLLVLAVGQVVFRRLEGRFAQEL